MSTGPQTPPPPPGPRGLMDEHEVAAFLNIPIGTFRRMRAKRDCPRITWIGRHARHDPADVQAYVDAQKEKPATIAPAVPLTARSTRRGRAA